MDEEQKRVEEQRAQEMAAETEANDRKYKKIAMRVGLVVLLALGVLGWKLLSKLTPPATTLAAESGPVCDAGTVDAATMMPAFIVPKDSQVILFLACDGYPPGTNGEVVTRMDGKAPVVIPFALEPVDGNASLFVTDMGLLPAGMYTIEFRTAGRQPRTLATTYTRVVAQ